MSLPLARIPVVAGLAYIECVRRLPTSFTATLVPESANRYFRHAIAVFASGEKVGYVAPEVSRRYFEALRQRADAPPVICPARRATSSDRETSGVELLLDFSAIELVPTT